jgi:monoamine oxidase
MVERVDVVVAGAGLTGLAAARELAAAGLSIAVLEARDRVGGRVESRVRPSGERFDTGGQFVCNDMPAIMALVRELGGTLLDMRRPGRPLDVPALSDADLEARVDMLRERVAALDPDDPALAGKSVEDWLVASDIEPAVAAAFRSLVDSLWCLDPAEFPLWHMIENERRFTNEVTELQYCVGETMHALAERMAAPLGAALRLETPVAAVERRGERLLVETASGPIDAGFVLLAMPPSMAARVRLDPPAPPALARARAVWKAGDVIKVTLRYPRPFWRERGLSGTIRWLEPRGLFACDASRRGDEHALVLFVGASMSRRLAARPEEEIAAWSADAVAAAFGGGVPEPLDVLVRNWCGDAWSGGAYSDLIRDAGARDAQAVLMHGAGRLRFASSELSPSFPGYMEGALVAGRLAACRIVSEARTGAA